MRVVTGVLGNVAEDDALAAARDRHDEAGTLEVVSLPRSERRKSRIRTTTDQGTELGIVHGTPVLEAGDVLLDDAECFLLVERAACSALVVDLETVSPGTAAELGHTLGNQHRSVSVRSERLSVELDAERQHVERVLEAHVPDATWRLQEVTDDRFSNTLSGSESATDEGHTQSHPHQHGHRHGEEHTHGDQQRVDNDS